MSMNTLSGQVLIFHVSLSGTVIYQSGLAWSPHVCVIWVLRIMCEQVSMILIFLLLLVIMSQKHSVHTWLLGKFQENVVWFDVPVYVAEVVEAFNIFEELDAKLQNVHFLHFLLLFEEK